MTPLNPRRIQPGPGQESVWDYPRPPRLEPTTRRIRVVVGDQVVVDTRRAFRVLETSHPPVYYVPPEDLAPGLIVPAESRRSSSCEFKGRAVYHDFRGEGVLSAEVAWSYPSPTPAFAPIKDYLAFYPGRADACYVDDERVEAQEGDFYGGWRTIDVVGPFKGAPGTWGW